MNRQIDQSNGLAQTKIPAILKWSRRLLPLPFLLVLFGCASSASNYVSGIKISTILANPLAHDGLLIRTEACVSVTIESMYLLECGTRSPVVDFTAGQSENSRRAFRKLIDLGHSMMGEDPEKIRVEVEGIYRHSTGKTRFDHTIEIISFKRMKS